MGEFQRSLRNLVGLYNQVLLLMTYSPIIDPSNHDKNHSGLSYSPSLEAAVQLLLADPAFQDAMTKVQVVVDYRDTPEFKKFFDADYRRLAAAVKAIGRIDDAK